MRYLKTVMIAGLVMSVTACSKAEDAPDNTTALVSNGPKLMSPDGPIRRCMNLGNGLDAPYEGAWDYQIEDHHIVEIARAGFDTMRFPIRWDTRTQLAAPYTIEPEFFDRVDHLLNLALDNGLQVIVDMHHFGPLMDDPAGQEARFLAMWEQIADHYKDYPDTVIFEVLNEPVRKLNNRKLERLFPKVLPIIRKTNPDRWVILSGDNWGSLSGLLGVELPRDDKTIWSYHSYVPWTFTHQGASWERDSPPVGTTWGTPEDYTLIEQRTQRVAEHGALNGHPILLGEFGAFGAEGRAPRESRLAWLTHMRRTNEAYNIGWCAWDFGAAFAYYDVETNQWDQELLDTLLGD